MGIKSLPVLSIVESSGPLGQSMNFSGLEFRCFRGLGVENKDIILEVTGNYL